jgi:very-short-patch-repair endonuclease
MRPKEDTLFRRIARLARWAHGVVTREELLEAGLSAGQIKRLLRSGALIPIHRGVYRVGHAAPSTEATYMAAVKAAGRGALLYGRAAAWVLGIVKGKPPPPEVLTASHPRITGVRVHRTRRIHRNDRGLWRGIPVTSAARTFVDLAPELAADELARAFHEAGIRHHITPDHVEEVLSRRPTSPDAAKVRAVTSGEENVVLSRLEAKFLSDLRATGERQLPVTNQPAGTKRVDCQWPELGLIIELDSYRYHRSRHAWEQDRRRERDARRRGEELHRFKHDDVFLRGPETAAEARRLIATRSRSRGGLGSSLRTSSPGTPPARA